MLPPVKTTPGQVIDNVTLKLTRPATVRGKVVDAKGRPVAGREVRAHAALRLPKLYPAGSAEPQLVAAQGRHADVRLAAITQLATAADPSPAIIEEMSSTLIVAPGQSTSIDADGNLVMRSARDVTARHAATEDAHA